MECKCLLRMQKIFYMIQLLNYLTYLIILQLCQTMLKKDMLLSLMKVAGLHEYCFSQRENGLFVGKGLQTFFLSELRRSALVVQLTEHCHRLWSCRYQKIMVVVSFSIFNPIT
ncbi:hypothetical protein OUZ56_020698 [Daphnia magna]|uniref:Uncharacterized protein n=1 Tax=Daphnia magna TaxID=35525 RepID=A0ABQ9ZF69_9CRUS|nr:hypothetical protein OUZ56_020698 [Daphnia magna]